MDSKNNVIDLASKRPKRESQAKTPKGKRPAAVVDMTDRRNEMLNRERREVKRTILSEFIGACAVIPKQGLARVSIYDISENGIAFDLETKAGRFQEGEEVAMRIYMNHQTYFPFVCTVTNVREIQDEEICRHGANLVKGSMNDVALHHFIKFIETVSASLHRDKGDVMVSNLR